ncbi:methyltransferase [Thalassobaculum fulvum]|uniref:Methyltransferase n=1 Tax=Thalassobaculum fulvum TaxID=1633335 RepID=A0A919CSG8_9PROT|nr:methyltransferase [Thalassobaculum fulvum]GHD57891.1 methyltransferase [Thalassobaculum fulvum]
MTSGDLRADRRVETARALTADGDHDGALSVLEQTLELTPDWPELHFLIGESAMAAGQRDRAVAAFTRYLALIPEDRHGALPLLALLGATPAPDALPAAYVAALFDEYAPRFEQSLLIGLGYRAPQHLLQAIDGIRGAEAGFGAVLDLGCGTGLMGERLRARAAWMEGIDLSGAMIAQAAGKGVYDVLHTAELIDHLAGETRKFDLITAADVLIYLGDLEPFFAAAADRLAAGGMLAVTVEAAEADGPGVDRRLRPSRRFAHSAGYVARAAAAAGLAVRHHQRAALRRDGTDTIEGHVMVFERPAAALRDRIEPPVAAPRRRRRRPLPG